MSGDFRVEWWDDALSDLAERWTEAEDRAHINLFVSGIEEALSRQPQEKGAEVAEGLRRLRFGPLRVYFQVTEENRLVEIVAVKPLP